MNIRTPHGDQARAAQGIERKAPAQPSTLTTHQAVVLETRATEHIIASDKAGLADDDLAEVKHQAALEALVWAIAFLTNEDEAEVMARLITNAPA